MFMCPGIHQISQRADRSRAKQCAIAFAARLGTISIAETNKHNVNRRGSGERTPLRYGLAFCNDAWSQDHDNNSKPVKVTRQYRQEVKIVPRFQLMCPSLVHVRLLMHLWSESAAAEGARLQ